ncbi:MAG: carboxypeptidase-like regulatory domain-containing protein [Bacteroidales bacterium]|nr:carboxypeptidase-like regulatory domain-containing protein [Bacteroidales bacterium]
MKNFIHLIYIISILVLYVSQATQAQNTRYRIYGHISDSITNESLPYISVRIKNSSNGCSSDNNGFFSFISSTLKDTLIVSSIGYKEKQIILTARTKFPLKVQLAPEMYELSEITIKPKKEKYSKKNNPAVELARKLIARREENSPKNKPFYSRDRHEKLNIALNNFSSSEESHFGKKFSFLDQYIDTSLVSGKPILHISTRELLATDYYRKSPRSERQHVKARQRAGIDDIVSEESIEAVIEETFKDVDIFQDNITLFRNKFVSPVSPLGINFYKYYIMDTVNIDGERCVDLTFAPHNPESMGFNGHLYVTTDSTYFIKMVQMNVPHDINLNFIQYMNIKQDFDRLEDGTRIINNESLVTEFEISSAVNGIYANREVAYRNYSFEDNEKATEILNKKTPVVEESNATNRDKEYWEANRIADVTEKEQSVAQMMQQLRNNPLYYWLEKGVTFLFTGWVPIREKNPPIFYGPVNTSISHNALEGTRLRTGAMTSAYLHPHLFGKFFVAYGLGDKELKYMGEMEYSFHKKKEHPNEFPIHSLRLHYENDIYQYGQTYLHTNKDNMFLTLKRKEDNKIGYLKKAEFTYTKEFYNHFSYALTLRNRVDIATHLIPFEKTATIDGITTSTFVKNLRQSEVELNLRYAPKEKFIQTKWNRHSVLPEHPVFTLSHKVGIKGIAGSELNYQHTELGFKKRFWFSAFGYTDAILKTGKVWNKVPFPLLIIPNANLSYTIQRESYALMNAMEFFNDEYASWDLTYYMSGLIFNRLPLIRKLNWREVIGFRGMFGNLSDKNRPDNANTGTLYKFPYEDETYHYLGSTPYMELSLGVENIFRVLRIDYVRRLTYRNYPGIDKEGVRIQLHMQF